MEKKELKALELKLRLAIEKVYDQGLSLNRGMPLGVEKSGEPSATGSVCLLGSVLLGHDRSGDHYQNVAARLLDISYADVAALESGFMDCDVGSPVAKLGKKLGRIYR